ncbi:MAG: GSCFA domain-containing protein [Bacteroidales bacterium]|nr:GSCFA domain-containing protein [Bacteroidales bacterium]
MDFRTIIEIERPDFDINYNSKCIFVGSCFAENIGSKLRRTKISASVNPTGILYNPLSIEKSIKNALNDKVYGQSDLFFANSLWNCYDFHSKFSGQNVDECLRGINEANSRFNEDLLTADYIFVTFGTAFVYQLAENNNIVCNCHKQPESIFSRRLLKVSEIVEKWVECIKQLGEANPKLRIIFTVSPIRHWRDGAVQNQVSKSSLHLAINELREKFEGVFYFPAYEILMDELRDYRFYASDMLHPSETAENYIWEKFEDTFFTAKTKEFVARVGKIMNACGHRPFNADSPEYASFCKKNLEKILELKAAFPSMDFSGEEEFFASHLTY